MTEPRFLIDPFTPGPISIDIMNTQVPIATSSNPGTAQLSIPDADGNDYPLVFLFLQMSPLASQMMLPHFARQMQVHQMHMAMSLEQAAAIVSHLKFCFEQHNRADDLAKVVDQMLDALRVEHEQKQKEATALQTVKCVKCSATMVIDISEIKNDLELHALVNEAVEHHHAESPACRP